MDPKNLEFPRKSPPESKKKKVWSSGDSEKRKIYNLWGLALQQRHGTETVVVRFTPCWDRLVMHKSCLLFKSYPHVRTPEDGLRDSKRNMKIPSHLLMSQAILGHYSNCCLHCCDQYPTRGNLRKGGLILACSMRDTIPHQRHGGPAWSLWLSCVHSQEAREEQEVGLG